MTKARLEQIPLATEDISGDVRSLEELEEVIKRGMRTFREVGKALLSIRERKLYKDKDYGTFDDYCRAEWGFGDHRARQMIRSSAATEEMETVTGVTVLPETERHARPLARVKDPEERVEVWQEVVEEAYGTKTPTPEQKPLQPITEAKVKHKVEQHLDLSGIKAAAQVQVEFLSWWRDKLLAERQHDSDTVLTLYAA